MKIIKNVLSFIILSLLSISLGLVVITYFTSTKQDEVDQITEDDTVVQTAYKPFTESPVQPIRKTYNEDYALRLMSVPRKNITDINVVNDYDTTLSKLQYNVNNNVATFKDKEILRVYYNIQEEQNND